MSRAELRRQERSQKKDRKKAETLLKRRESRLHR